MPQQIRISMGKVYISDNQCDVCTCGEMVCKNLMGNFMENEIETKVFIGICKCGNIFKTSKYGK